MPADGRGGRRVEIRTVFYSCIRQLGDNAGISPLALSDKCIENERGCWKEPQEWFGIWEKAQLWTPVPARPNRG